MTPTGKTRLVIAMIYVAAVAANVVRAEITQDALAFHTRDYPFYLQFATKLLDSRIAPVYSMNPDGYNVLFFNGTDGAEGLHQSLHLEPLKYVYAAVYYLTGSSGALYLLIALVFFLPLLYLGWLTPLNTPESRRFAVVLSLLYAIYPASLAVSAFDLRPFAFLAPFFALTMIALEFDRPVREIAVFFGGMFLAREEALVFGAIVIGYAALRMWGSPRWRSVVASLCSIWAAALVLIASYFWWTGYRNTLAPRFAALWASAAEHWTVTVGIFAVLLALTAGVAWGLRKAFTVWRVGEIQRVPRWLQVATYCAVFPPLAMQFLRERSEELAALDTVQIGRVLSTPRFGLHLAAVVILFVILQRLTTAPSSRQVLNAAAVVGVAISALVAVSAPFGYRARIAALATQSHSAAQVLALRNGTDKYKTEVLTDYSTFQAFADYQHVYSYERLPSYLVDGPARFFPANQGSVQALIDGRVQYVVVSRASMRDIESFLAKSGVRTTTEFANAEFVALQLWRK